MLASQIKKVLISDCVDEKCSALLRQNGMEVVCKYRLPEDQLIQELQGCQGLIVRSETKVTANVMKATALKVIGRAGTGVDNIDVDEATKKAIIVLNAPGGNAISACELTCSLIMCLARQIPPSVQSMKEGKWERKLFSGGFEVMGKTLAIIGLGRIGKEVALRMKAFGMKVIGYDPIVTREAAQTFNVEKMELDELWSIADFVTVHTPLIPQTKNLINEQVFAKCKKGLKVVNVARGGIVDEKALLEALENGKCGGAALDVFSEEPPKSEFLKKLISHPKVIATPHLGASTVEAQTKVAVEVAEQFIALNDSKSSYQLTGIVNGAALFA